MVWKLTGTDREKVPSGINKVLDSRLSTWRKMKKQKLGGVLAPLFPTVNSLGPVYGQKLREMERPLSAEHHEIQQTSEKIRQRFKKCV